MFDLDIFEWMVLGPMAENLVDEEEERHRLEEDLDQDDDE